ncbi:MAG: hypothetical protein GYB49_14510 [Alphaproteobacteria bacterium]|nr:hypothetical protein [Alphaproteobacteria bacterium]
MTSKRAPYRVIQWATGAMGKSCLRAVIDRPDMELAGLYVYSETKAGKDAGEIAHRDTTGVLATNNIDDILNTDADLVIHAARIGQTHTEHDDDIIALLKSGKNVLSINGNTFSPNWPRERQERLQAACLEGGVSFAGAGLNPGFAAENLLVTATSVCSHVESVSISETVLTDQIASPEYVFDLLGFGKEVGSIDLTADDWGPAQTLNDMFEDVVASVAHSLGWTLDDIERRHRMLPSGRDLEIRAGKIAKGTANHIDWRWSGMKDGAEKVALNIAWAMNDEHVQGADHDLWQIAVKGVPDVSVAFGVQRPEAYPGRTSAEQLAVAGSVVNAIPTLVNAPAGLLTSPITTPFAAYGGSFVAAQE